MIIGPDICLSVENRANITTGLNIMLLNYITFGIKRMNELLQKGVLPAELFVRFLEESKNM